MHDHTINFSTQFTNLFTLLIYIYTYIYIYILYMNKAKRHCDKYLISACPCVRLYIAKHFCSTSKSCRQTILFFLRRNWYCLVSARSNNSDGTLFVQSGATVLCNLCNLSAIFCIALKGRCSAPSPPPSPSLPYVCES